MRFPYSTPTSPLVALRLAAIAVIVALLATSAARADVDPAERLAGQRQIESEITTLLRGQLAPEEFFVVADVELDEGTVAAGESAGGGSASLPYLTLKVDPAKLSSMAEGSAGVVRRKIKAIRAEITFDRRIPEAKRKILEQAVGKKLAVDGASRTLTVRTETLVTESIPDQLRSEAQRAQAAALNGASSDKAKFDLESERMKLEVAKRDLEIQRNRLEQTRELSTREAKVRELETKLLAVEAAVAEERKRAESGSGSGSASAATEAGAGAAKDDGGALGGLAKIQVLLFGIILAVAVILGLVMGSGAFKKGMTALAGGFASIGSGMKEAATAHVEAQREMEKAARADRLKAAAEGHRDEESKGEAGQGQGHGAGGAAGNSMPTDEGERARLEEFLVAVQDKIEILAKERSFALYREMQDLVDSDQSLPLASALLLALSREATAELVKGLTAAHMERLKRHLARPGAIQEAKASRNAALQEFYGRIAVEEFGGSPILKLTDVAWLARLGNAELARITSELAKPLRPAFLACFSPVRVKKMVEASGDETMKKALMTAVVELGAATPADLEKLFAELPKLKAKAEATKETGGLVDGARYLGRLAESLGDEDQKLLLDEIGRKDDVRKDFAKHYVAFDAVQNLPKEMLMEIFGERANEQIAMLIFAAAEPVRQAVIKALPEVKAATVVDELKLLDAKTFYKKRNEKQSLALQRQISTYLLRLKDEGLLDDTPKTPRAVA